MKDVAEINLNIVSGSSGYTRSSVTLFLSNPNAANKVIR